MAIISLDIYKEGSKTEIEKTYTAQGYDLMVGTVEDFMAIIDVDKIGETAEIAKMIFEGYSQVKALIMDVFEGITDEEFKRVKTNDLVRCIVSIGTSVVESLNHLKTEKN